VLDWLCLPAHYCDDYEDVQFCFIVIQPTIDDFVCAFIYNIKIKTTLGKIFFYLIDIFVVCTAQISTQRLFDSFSNFHCANVVDARANAPDVLHPTTILSHTDEADQTDCTPLHGGLGGETIGNDAYA